MTCASSALARQDVTELDDVADDGSRSWLDDGLPLTFDGIGANVHPIDIRGHLRDGVAVLGAPAQGLEDDHVERALEQLDTGKAARRHGI